MPSGGARPRSGPLPDPTALRRERKEDQAGWVTLPAERTGPLPDWPLPGPASPAEMEHWVKLWKTPQSTVWEREGVEDDVALYTRSFVAAAQPGAPVGLIKEVRLMRDDLGLSPGAALRKRWQIAGSTPAATASAPTSAARPSRGRSSARDRLKVVDPAKE